MSVLKTRQSSADSLPLLKPGDNFDVWYSRVNVRLASVAVKNSFPDQPSSLTDVVLAAHFRVGLLDDKLRWKLIKKLNLSSGALLTLVQEYEELCGPSVAAPCYSTSVARQRHTRSMATQTLRNFTRPFRGRQAGVAQVSIESYLVPAVTSSSGFPAPIINATVADKQVAILVDTGAAGYLLNLQSFTRTWLQPTEISHRHPRIVAANAVLRPSRAPPSQPSDLVHLVPDSPGFSSEDNTAVRNLIFQNSAAFAWDGEPLGIRSGFRQGCILSSILLNYAIDWILGGALREGDGVGFATGHRLTDLDYADDMALLASSFGDLQSMVSRVTYLSPLAGDTALSFVVRVFGALFSEKITPIVTFYGRQQGKRLFFGAPLYNLVLDIFDHWNRRQRSDRHQLQRALKNAFKRAYDRLLKRTSKLNIHSDAGPSTRP
nr:unnamed protein product [Spirometra erinaceieuropaei]